MRSPITTTTFTHTPRPVIGLLLAVASLIAAAPAGAQSNCGAAPGDAAVDQYCEVVPDDAGGGSDGSTSGSGGGSGGIFSSLGGGGGGASGAGDGAGGSPVTGGNMDSVVGSLSGVLGDGAVSGGERGGGGERADGSPGNSPAGSLPEAPSNNPLTAVTSAAEDGATTGSALVWALAAAGLLLAGVAWTRHRRAGDVSATAGRR